MLILLFPLFCNSPLFVLGTTEKGKERKACRESLLLLFTKLFVLLVILFVEEKKSADLFLKAMLLIKLELSID